MIRRNAYIKREKSFGQNISAAQSAGAGASLLADGRENHSDERGGAWCMSRERDPTRERGREGGESKSLARFL